MFAEKIIVRKRAAPSLIRCYYLLFAEKIMVRTRTTANAT
jgi:hypothetical protein